MIYKIDQGKNYSEDVSYRVITASKTPGNSTEIIPNQSIIRSTFFQFGSKMGSSGLLLLRGIGILLRTPCSSMEADLFRLERFLVVSPL